MKAVVLAAGKGTRLFPLTKDIPKPMMPVGNRPLLEHILINLKKQGINNIIINLHYQPKVITDYFGDGRQMGLDINYSFEPEIMGTAGGVKRVAKQLDKPFLVVYGDNFSRFNCRDLTAFHRVKRGAATVALIKGADPASGGIALLDKEDRVTNFLEKPRPDRVFSPWINAGIYVLQPEILEFIPKNTYYDFGRHLFPKLIRSKSRIFGFKMFEALQGINTIEEYRDALALYRRTVADEN